MNVTSPQTVILRHTREKQSLWCVRRCKVISSFFGDVRSAHLCWLTVEVVLVYCESKIFENPVSNAIIFQWDQSAIKRNTSSH